MPCDEHRQVASPEQLGRQAGVPPRGAAAAARGRRMAGPVAAVSHPDPQRPPAVGCLLGGLSPAAGPHGLPAGRRRCPAEQGGEPGPPSASHQPEGRICLACLFPQRHLPGALVRVAPSRGPDFRL